MLTSLIISLAAVHNTIIKLNTLTAVSLLAIIIIPKRLLYLFDIAKVRSAFLLSMNVYFVLEDKQSELRVALLNCLNLSSLKVFNETSMYTIVQ